MTDVEIYGNVIYDNVWARGIPVIGGARVLTSLFSPLSSLSFSISSLFPSFLQLFQIRIYENRLTNILSSAFWVAAEGYIFIIFHFHFHFIKLVILTYIQNRNKYNTLSPRDIIYARNVVINSTNYLTNCSKDWGGLPATGVSNGNDKSPIDRILFMGINHF